MDPRFSKYVPGVLLVAALVSGACSQTENAISPAGPTSASLSLVTAEPDRVEPELLPRGRCTSFPGFRTQFTLIAAGGQSLAISGLQFTMVDRFGNSFVPILFTTGFPASHPTPRSMPITLPTPTPIPNAMPIPVPTSGRVDGLSPVQTQQFPLSVEFGCNIHPRGTLTVGVDTTDGRGRKNTSRVSVQIGD